MLRHVRVIKSIVQSQSSANPFTAYNFSVIFQLFPKRISIKILSIFSPLPFFIFPDFINFFINHPNILLKAFHK